MRFDVARPYDPSRDGAAGAVQSVDEVLATGELARRPARARDFCAEKKALAAITREMAANPHGVLQTVAELAVALCHAESAGVSILEPDGAPGSGCTLLRCQAASGEYARYRGQILPREAAPCGAAIDSGDTQLFEHPARVFPRMHDFTPQIVENLSSPWSVDGQVVGTVWAATHTPGYRFDAEDARLLRMLGTLAATAWQTARAQEPGRDAAATAAPEARIDVCTRLLSDCIAMLRTEIEQRRSAEAALQALEARRGDELEAMRRLYELHARLATETSLPAALDHVLATACGFARADRGHIELRSEDGGRMETVAVRGDAGSGGAALATLSTPLVNREGDPIGMLSTQVREMQRAGPEALRLMELLAWTAADFVERHRAQAELRRSAARQAYLLRLNAVLRRPGDPVRIQVEAARVLAEHLGASRAGYANDAGDSDHLTVADIHAGGVPALDGHYRYADYGAELLPALRAGQTVVRRDIAADPGLGAPEKQACAGLAIAASVLVPLVRDGRLIAVLFAHQDRPRDWSAAEVALIQETAERTWAAVERARAVEALKEADQRKDEFLATLAHELRNPLAPISNAVHLMRRPDGRRVTDRLMGIVERQVNQIVKLVDDLLEISRITSGKIELDRQPVRLADAVHDAVETSRPLVERARHQLSVTLPDEPLTLCADGVRLTQVLSNLVNNAAKYTEAGGRIWLDAAREGDGVSIRVRDNGPGIPENQLGRVFDMFAQAQLPGETGGSDGLGIGLAIVRKLVEMHGGTVEAHSPGLGQGSEFVVRLPLQLEGDAACPLPVCMPRGALGGRRILVVDDNRDAADTLALLLESHGALTRVAYGGEAALAELDVFMPDTLLLDLGMPGMDGFAVARRLRADPRHASLRVVALTGWGQENDRRRTREAGFDHHLTKPVDFVALEAWLTEH